MGETDQTGNQKKKTKSALLLVNAICLAIGVCSGPMIMRLYFIHGGKRVWLSSWLESGGWPINFILLLLTYLHRRHKQGPSAAKLVFMGGRLFTGAAITGVLCGADYFLYAYGVSRLPISTFNDFLWVTLKSHSRHNPKVGLFKKFRKYAK